MFRVSVAAAIVAHPDHACCCDKSTAVVLTKDVQAISKTVFFVFESLAGRLLSIIS